MSEFDTTGRETVDVITADRTTTGRRRLESFVAEFVPDERFIWSPDRVDAWAGEGRYRHETGYLIDAGDPGASGELPLFLPLLHLVARELGCPQTTAP